MTSFIKRYIILLLYISGFSQANDLDIGEVSLDRLYFGLYGKEFVKTDSADAFNSSTLRLGALLSKKFNNQIKIRSFALMKFETSEPIKSNGSFEIVYQPNSFSRLQLGYVGTAFSELRPNPLTPESQTEYSTQSKIPGAKPTLKYFRELKHFSSLTTSLSYDHSLLGYQLKFSRKHLALGFQAEKYNVIGAVEYHLKNYSSISVYNFSRSEFNQALIYSFKEYLFYVEGEINSGQISQNFEIGVRSNFTNHAYPIKGFLGLSYNNFDKMISGQLFIHFKESFFKRVMQ